MFKVGHILAVLICVCILLQSCSKNPNLEPDLIRDAIQIPSKKLVKLNSSIVQQTNSNETQALVRLARNLEELNALIDEAEFHAQADSRIRFDYRQLRLDLSAVTQGIRTHIRLPNFLPRSIDPIPGEYGR